MDQPDNIPEEQTEHYALLCEIKRLRAELAEAKAFADHWRDCALGHIACEQHTESHVGEMVDCPFCVADRLRAELNKQDIKLANKTASIDGLLEKWRDAEKENGELRAELAQAEKTEAQLREANQIQQNKIYGFQGIKHRMELAEKMAREERELRLKAQSELAAEREKFGRVRAVLDAALEETRMHGVGMGAEGIPFTNDCGCRLCQAVREWREK